MIRCTKVKVAGTKIWHHAALSVIIMATKRSERTPVPGSHLSLWPVRGKALQLLMKARKAEKMVRRVYSLRTARAADRGLVGWLGGRGAEGVARLKLFKQSVFFHRPFPALCCSSPPPNTTALLFPSAERGEIRCHHSNIKVPGRKSAYKFRPALPVMATCHSLSTSVVFTKRCIKCRYFSSLSLSLGLSF